MHALEKFRNTFKKKDRVVLPVIHVRNYAQALRNADIAKDCGADGVWFISMDGDVRPQALLEMCSDISVSVDIWGGVNILSWMPHTVFENARMLTGGIWTDNAMIHEHLGCDTEDLKQYEIIRQKFYPDGLYFGGVAFKYQRKVRDLDKVINAAKPYMDVLTTSGDGTGIAAGIEKIQAIHAAANGHPIALASGITPENVERYLPYVNAYLVATGINSDFYNLDPVKTKALVKAVGEYK